MADAASNKSLSNEAAEALLTSIRDEAKSERDANSLLALAQAYAVVVDAAPKRDGSGRVGSVR